jgi:transposase
MKTKSDPNTNVTRLVKRVLEAKSVQVKLGIDQHARDVVVSMQQDASMPQRAQKMHSDDLLMLVRGLVKGGVKVFACYEAGPCGFWLYRALLAAGGTAYVIAPQALGGARKQKTDQLDALALCDALDRYVRGNRKAFTVVTVPSEEAEQKRVRSRVRNQLKQERTRLAAQGRSLLLNQGHHVEGSWWLKAGWEGLKETLPDWLISCLEELRALLLKADEQEKTLRKELEADAREAPRPKAIGPLTWVLLTRELCDWSRFKNRRQVAGYTGLCAGVDQSGAHHRDGSINRCGNPRVRALLIEAVWRLCKWQPDYPPVRKLVDGIVRGAARRKLAVAAARRLAIDLWRLATGQTTLEKLNLLPA